MKRRFGEALKSRKYRFQIKEIEIKVVLYTLSRMISTFLFLVLIEDFSSQKIVFPFTWDLEGRVLMRTLFPPKPPRHYEYHVSLPESPLLVRFSL
jgi:hypothetical protein